MQSRLVAKHNYFIIGSVLKKATPKGFQPLRAEPIGFRVHLFDRSDTVSLSSRAIGSRGSRKHDHDNSCASISANNKFGRHMCWSSEQERQFAQVAEGVDLRSAAGNCAWVRSPQLTYAPVNKQIPKAKQVSYQDLIARDCCHGAHGVMVSHLLSMREALGSLPSVSIFAQRRDAITNGIFTPFTHIPAQTHTYTHTVTYTHTNAHTHTHTHAQIHGSQTASHLGNATTRPRQERQESKLICSKTTYHANMAVTA